MVDNEQIARKVRNAIQREEINEEVRNLINEADKYLLEGGEKPGYYDDFIKKTLADLSSTINGCVKSRNNEKKKDDLKKYKEGYFNEIVQNANDVVWKTESENPEILVAVSKENSRYSVTCSYPDKGFTLENLYGFCTRGNSDKKSDNGQEGMYGIGIKSLFCFVDELHISSNIDIEIKSCDDKLDTVDIKDVKKRNEDITCLSFSFTKDDKHAGFNTCKLVKFIDWIVSNERDENIEQFLLNGKDNQIVFDVRSLFFTELRGIGRTSKNSIKKIIFRKCEDISERDIIIEAEEDVIEIDSGDFDKTIVKIVRVFDKRYVLIHYKEEQISIAYEYNVNDKNSNEDRLYSTYFIGTYLNKQPLLDVKIGCLVNTAAINSSRSGLERENEKEPEVLCLINKKGKDTIKILCSLISKDTNNERKNIYIDILCRLLYLFRDMQVIEGKEWISQGIVENSESVINNCIDKWQFNNKKYVLYEEDGIEDEKVMINRPPDSDEENVKNLYATYKSKFYNITNTTETDIMLYGSEEYEKLTEGIKSLCKYILEDKNSLSWLKGIRFPFIEDVKGLIKKRIGSEEFQQIMSFLSNIEDKQEKLNIKQLIARYKVNESFNFMGIFSSKNIVNWLFDTDTVGYSDDEYEKECSQYEKNYSQLKYLMQNKISESKYYSSVNGNASSNWWYEYNRYVDLDASSNWWKKYENKLWEDNFEQLTINEQQILQLLELINKGYLYVGYNEDTKIKFITDRSKNIILQNYWKDSNEYLRERKRYSSWNSDIFKFFSLTCLSIIMETFHNFRKAREYIDNYNKSEIINFNFNLVSPKCCKIREIKYTDLEQIMKWLSIYRNLKDVKIIVNAVVDLPQNDRDSDVIRFIKKFIGEDVCVCFNKISVENKGRNFIGFVSNLNLNGNPNKTSIYIKQSNDLDLYTYESDSYEEKTDKYLLVYSSVDDEQRILAYILKHLGYGPETCQYIHNFIQTGNNTQLSSKEFKKFVSQKKLHYEYPFTYEEYICKKMENNLSMDSIYTILSGEMSYDDHCPLCNAIPTLNIKEENLNLLEKRNSLIAMFSAKYGEKDIYIKILCCKSCFNQYKLTLTSAEIVEKDDFKILKLTQTISDSMRMRNIITNIILSPDNWEIIKRFNDLV